MNAAVSEFITGLAAEARALIDKRKCTQVKIFKACAFLNFKGDFDGILMKLMLSRYFMLALMISCRMKSSFSCASLFWFTLLSLQDKSEKSIRTPCT